MAQVFVRVQSIDHDNVADLLYYVLESKNFNVDYSDEEVDDISKAMVKRGSNVAVYVTDLRAESKESVRVDYSKMLEGVEKAANDFDEYNMIVSPSDLCGDFHDLGCLQSDPLDAIWKSILK
jgi:hypothetical protein